MKAKYRGIEYTICSINFVREYMLIGEEDFTGMRKVDFKDVVILISKKEDLRFKIV